jgi:hypothetical protein
MSKILGAIALTGLLLSILVHFSALLGIDVSLHFPYVWGLHIGIFVVFIPFVLMSRGTLGAKPRWTDIRQQFPGWAIALALCVWIYVIVNFVLFILFGGGGSPNVINGEYVLSNHGRVLSHLTETAYRRHVTNEVRGFSGHWLIFYLIPCLYFLCRRDQGLRGIRAAGE